MAYNRAETGGLAYALPANRYIEPAQEVAPGDPLGAAPVFDLPKVDSPLDYVEGMTDEYYDTRGKIEKYAMDMWKTYGIDVTQPDYTAPGGGIPFKTYQKLGTDLLVQANDLASSFKIKQAEAPYRMSGAIQDVQGGTDPSVPLNRQAPNQRYFSTKLLPKVEQANEILRTAVYTEADYKRFKEQVLDPTIAELTAEMNKEGISPAERERLQYNINALVQQPRTTPYAVFQNDGKGKKATFEIDVLKKVKNDIQGRWSPGSYTPRTDENGDPVLYNPAWKGTRLGEAVIEVDGKEKRVDKIVDGLIKKTDGVYFTFENKDIAPVKVSSQKGDEIARIIMESNPKFGSAEKMYQAMRELELADESGSLKPEALLAEGEEFDSGDPTAFGAGIKAEKERLKKLIEEGTENDPGANLWKNRPKIPFTLPDGSTATLIKHRNGDGWFVDELEDKDSKYTHMTWDDVQRWLAAEGYFDQYLVSKPGTTPEEEALGQLKEGPPPAKEPGETQAAYDLRLIRWRRTQKK